MKQRSISLPLLVVVAVVALVLGSFGTATAAGITKAQVKKIAGKVVDQKASSLSVANAVNAQSAAGVPDSAINSADVANGTLTAADLATGVITPILWARTNEGGVLQGNSGAVSAVRNSTGNYTITFNRPVTTCAAVVTPLGNQYVTYTNPTASTVVVDVEDNAGAQSDASLSTVVVC